MATYTVQPGDNLSAIAEANGITLADVIRLNPQISNPDLIHPGDVITISEDAVVTAAIGEAPAAEATPEAATGEATAEAATAEAPAVPEALVEAVTEAATPAAPPTPSETVAAVEEATVVEGRPAV